MKRLTAIILLCIFSLTLFAGCEENVFTSPTGGRDVDAIMEEKMALEIKKVELDKSLIYFATIEIADYGTIKVQLEQEVAPITVANFVSLAQSGFYDNLTFHRIIKGFMMQGGDPCGNGTGGANEDIKGEFSANGYVNNISHKRGVISMARANPYDSASSQFFIMHEDSASLDGQYAAFGYVIEGMDVVDAVCNDAKPTDGNGTIPVNKQPVITKVTISTEKGRDAGSISAEKDMLDITKNELDKSLIYYATIEIEDYGTIEIELDQVAAPITVANFVSLAQSGFYNNLTFHSAINGMLIQGGDPKGDGSGGAKETIKGEFATNGHNNYISHKRGIISMARGNDKDSASSQFFITHKDLTRFDGDYAAFGYVINGMNIVDKICQNAIPVDSNGKLAINDQPVIKSVSITTKEARDIDAIIAEKEALEITKVKIDESLDYFATIDIKGYGEIKVRLDAEAAPITVANFVSLAQSGFYDNLSFHRIMDGFMMQGGDPCGNGTGGANETIFGEFADNGFENSISHERGVISMARAKDYNSASSQFFIMHKTATGLDGSYAAFGYVLEGMDIVDEICENAIVIDNNGTVPAQKQPVINTITITTEAKT